VYNLFLYLSISRETSRIRKGFVSGAGRIVAGGADEKAAWAEKMDEWIIWEDGKKRT
jgi:hypothetical protein